MCAHKSASPASHTHGPAVQSHSPDAHCPSSACQDQPRLSLAVIGTACCSPTTVRGGRGTCPSSPPLTQTSSRKGANPRYPAAAPDSPVLPKGTCDSPCSLWGAAPLWREAGLAPPANGKPTSLGVKWKPAQVLGDPRGVMGALLALVSAPAPSEVALAAGCACGGRSGKSSKEGGGRAQSGNSST